MKVLGIDPGSQRTGWGVVECAGSRVVHLGSGVLDVGSGELTERLVGIAQGLEAVIASYQPQAAAIEQIFHSKNAQSALVLGHARGVALVTVARAGLPVAEYTPGQVKQATVGRGRADKDQVQAMVRMILNLGSEPMALDASDALGAAVCHAMLYATPTAAAWREAEAKHKRRPLMAARRVARAR